MRVSRDVSIRQRLIRISLFTSGFALILSALFLTINEVMVFKQAILSELTTQAEIIGSNCTAALTFNDAKAAKEILSALRANKSIEFAMVYGNDGILFADYSSNGGKLDRPNRLLRKGQRFGLNHVEVYDDIVLDHNVVGAIYLYSNLKALYGDLFRLAGVFLAIILLSLPAVYLLSAGLQKSIAGLIADLVGTMKTISEGKDYSVRAAVRSQDELGVLAEGFNAMLIQIQMRDAELEAYRKNLEELVGSRTEQLQAANEQLQEQLAERKRVEDALRESETFIKAVMDNLPIGIAVNTVDPRVNFLYMNDNFARSYRTTRDALDVPDGFWGAVYEDPDFRDTIKMRVLADCASGNPEQMHWLDIPITRKGEETTYVEAVNTPMPGRGVMISTVWDVSERIRAKEELKKSEKFIEDILASVDEAFVVVDREYRILMANRAYCKQTGKPLEGIVGRYCYEMLHHETQPCHSTEYVCGFKRTFETGEPVTTVHRHTDDKGRQRQVEVKTYALKDETGGVTSVIEVINDITEKTLLEGQLRQAQKMEAIGTLAGGIAHDFNNILTAIIGFGEIVMEQLPPGSQLQEEQLHVLQAGKRARDLVKQILTFSRRNEQQLHPLLVQFVVKEALKLLRASIPTSIEIREDIDVNCGLVLVDPGQIHQVVMNLCTNAYQAMRETGGVLLVSLKSIVVSEEDAEMTVNLHPGPYVRLEVADTGCGMSEAVRERIFEPYFTTKGIGEGTGLGLSLVHGIVTGLGGGLNVYSEPGLGTTFKVYLPLIAGEAPGVVLTSEVAPGGDESLLVVDDEESITRLERKVLEKLGYRVAAFTDSEMALQAFRTNPHGFDLVLTDMTMPRLNGDGLAREILAIRPELPIVLCTGFSELIDSERAKVLGISDLLQKPVEKGDLARAVRRALDELRQSSG